MIFIVDPGLDGAILLLDEGGGTFKLWDMPTYKTIVNGEPRRKIDVKALIRIFDSARGVREGYIERVGPMRQRPGQQDTGKVQQGLVSAFSFGKGVGIVVGVMMTCGLLVREIDPVSWKGKVALIKQPKDDSRKRASELFPDHANLWTLKKHDGRSDVACMGWYALRFGAKCKEVA